MNKNTEIFELTVEFDSLKVKARFIAYAQKRHWQLVESFIDNYDEAQQASSDAEANLPCAVYFDNVDQLTQALGHLDGEFPNGLKYSSKALKNEAWLSPWEDTIENFSTEKLQITFGNGNLTNIDSALAQIQMVSYSDFGTGQHATTKACLYALEKLNPQPIENALDLGTGTGILTIAASKLLNPEKMIATDIEQDILDRAKKNFLANNTNVETICHEGMPKGLYDLIIANILFPVLIAEFEHFYDQLTSHGHLLIAGFSSHHLDRLDKIANDLGFDKQFQVNVREWLAVTYKKSRPLS